MRSLAIGCFLLAIAVAQSAGGDESLTAKPPAQLAPAKPPGEPMAALASRQIRLQLAIAEVSLSGMLRRELDFAQLGLRQQTPAPPGFKSRPFTGQQQVPPGAAKTLVDSLARQEVLKVVAGPILIVGEEKPGYFFSAGKISKTSAKPELPQNVVAQKVGTEVRVTAQALSDSRVRLELHAIRTDAEPLVSIARRGGTAPAYRKSELNTPIEVDLGMTAICGGLAQQETVRDPRTRRNEQRETQTLFLITPTLYDPAAGELASPSQTKPDAAKTK